MSEYGEPWVYSVNESEDEHYICDANGGHIVDCVGGDLLYEEIERIVACVNALAGIPNPEAWVADVRDLLWELKFYDEHADGSTLGFNWGIIQKRLAALSTPSPRPQQQ